MSCVHKLSVMEAGGRKEGKGKGGDGDKVDDAGGFRFFSVVETFLCFYVFFFSFYTNSRSLSRTTRTGHGAARATRSAVLPRPKCFQPLTP